MPELPEVETIKNVLNPIVKGRTILSIDVLRDSTIVGDKEFFVTSLVGKTFKEVTRIGKFMIFHLSDDMAFISHLRMEGKYFELPETSKNTMYARVVFHLDNGNKLCYDDSRCFGIMILTSENEYKNVKDIAQLGPEPFYVDDVNYLLERTKKSSLPIKTTLLDQTLMTGIGNIYADEILFASKIHPLTPAKKITKDEWIKIVKNAQRILKDAIEQGGSTIRSYHPGKDIDGNFQTRLLAYGRSDKPCIDCGATMRFIKVGGRGTTFCPHCQIKKGGPIKVAIFGKISSGKSSVLNIFKQHNIPVFSSDEEVRKLYQNEKVIKDIVRLFSLKSKDHLDRDELREIVQNISLKRRLERYVHPLVKEECHKFLKQKEDILVAEVPLLYEAEMEDMFDVIIYIDINKDIQIERLEKRNAVTADSLRNINALNAKFDENKKKADFVISNNADLESLNKQVNEIINKLKDRLS